MCAVLNHSRVQRLATWSPPGFSVHGDSPGKNTGVGCHALLQEIFPTQESNPSLPHCRQILYCLSHWGSPYTSACVCVYKKRNHFDVQQKLTQHCKLTTLNNKQTYIHLGSKSSCLQSCAACPHLSTEMHCNLLKKS